MFQDCPHILSMSRNLWNVLEPLFPGLLLLTVHGSEIHTMVEDQVFEAKQPKQDLLLQGKKCF